MKPNNEDRPYEVLVVDDSALVGESLRLLLASQGFVVKKVTSTEEA
jgi:PleD family two-component response regulator